uniref:CHCH domain-containing protein n=1 Tax=Syphacia muris TaxID=451379 RepID=A0A0N5AIB9_9BILA
MAALRNTKPIITPPMNGSFPLDREGKCKLQMLEYMICMQENKKIAEKCRPLAKEYMECRMNNNLLERDDWEYLGFSDENKEATKEDLAK